MSFGITSKLVFYTMSKLLFVQVPVVIMVKLWKSFLSHCVVI